MQTEAFRGLGKAERRRMIKRWHEEGRPQGLSLRKWASQQHPVGDSAYTWLRVKKGKT